MLAAPREQLGDLVDVQTWSLDDTRLAERFAQVAALRASADELMARMAGEMDDRGLAKRHGASSTRAHLMASFRMSAGEASRVARRSSWLP